MQTLGRLADPDEFANIVVKQTPTRWCGSRTWPRSSSPRSTMPRTPISTATPRWRSPSSSGPARTRSRPRQSIIDHGGAVEALSARHQVRHRLQPDAVHPAVGRRGGRDHRRGDRARRAGRDPVPADLARRRSFRSSPSRCRWSARSSSWRLFGFTLNNLSLFGLVLAIGIVVDDAIVVVENVERNIAAGLAPREAAIKSMDEVGAALIAIALVLCAVFVPSAFITGISGQFYRQFALTIAGATVISLIVSLTLSPAMCALLLKPHDPAHATAGGSGRSTASSAASTGASSGWAAVSAGWPRAWCASPSSCWCVYAGVIGYRPQRVPQDAGRLHPAGRSRLLIVVVQLPPGASLARTDEVQLRALDDRARDARASRMPSTSSASPARPSPMRRMPARSS